jgi:enamine deaminase RidA (YjgF/YER057c/UK114 family)
VERRRVSSGAPWESIVGYCRAVRVGNVIHVAGTTAVGPEGKVLAPGNADEQTRIILRKVESALKELGASMTDVVRTRMYVTDIARWEDIGRAHGEFFASVRPAATMVEVSRLIDPDMLVEIEVEAIVG